jgi:putative ABC transport system substrate-binding protein
LPIFDVGKTLIYNTMLKEFLNSCSDNLKSKTCGESCRTIENPKWLGLSVIALVLVVLGAVAQAQQITKVPRIGFLGLATKPLPLDEAFLHALQELGYIDGQNVIIEYRWAAGKTDRLPALAEELVRLKLDVIVGAATPVIQALKNATKTIPIVMLIAADPVGTGFVASLARPGGNITGMAAISPELAGKRLELLREVLPKLSRVAFLAHAGDPAHKLFVKEAQEAAEKFRMKFHSVVIGGPEEFESAFSAMIKEGTGALVVQPLFIGFLLQGRRIADLAARNRLPTISDVNQFAEEGGLMGYGPDRVALFRRAATFVDKILKGSKPADLPVEQPTKFEFIINLKTAKQIGLTIPQSVLYRADKVIK